MVPREWYRKGRVCVSNNGLSDLVSGRFMDWLRAIIVGSISVQMCDDAVRAIVMIVVAAWITPARNSLGVSGWLSGRM